MNDMIQFYYNPMSRARVVHWGLEEVGVPYELKIINLQKGEQKKADYLAINPMGKVPAIVHRGTVITEVAAILTYLGDAFPKAQLAPGIDDPKRGTYLRWLFFVAGCYETAVLEKINPRVTAARPGTLGFGSYEDTMNTVEKILEPSPYLLGDQFTMADLYLGAQLGWSLKFKTIEPRPIFTSYVERCHARPAAQRAEAQAMEFMKKMQATS